MGKKKITPQVPFISRRWEEEKGWGGVGRVCVWEIWGGDKENVGNHTPGNVALGTVPCRSWPEDVKMIKKSLKYLKLEEYFTGFFRYYCKNGNQWREITLINGDLKKIRQKTPQTKNQQPGNQLSDSSFHPFLDPLCSGWSGSRPCLTVSSYKKTLSVQAKEDAKDLWALSA